MFRTATFTPLFNIPDFLIPLEQAPVDETFHMRMLETIIFPKREIVIISQSQGVATVYCSDYPWSLPLYTLTAFLEIGKAEEKPPLPSATHIIQRLLDFPKMPYLLGGNTTKKINLGLTLSFSPFFMRNTSLYGIDCSGLLYFVTGGNTPRNTKELMEFGEVVEDLCPLDLIVFKGHVLIYLGNGLVIESREIDGVIISRWDMRKKAITKPYRFIRFHPEACAER